MKMTFWHFDNIKLSHPTHHIDIQPQTAPYPTPQSVIFGHFRSFFGQKIGQKQQKLTYF